MNVYFLVEGERTEVEFYDSFIQYYFEGGLTKVEQIQDVEEANYFILSAQGYPRVFTSILPRTIQDLNSYQAYNHLVICVDTDEHDHAHRQVELEEHLSQYQKDGIVLHEGCQLHLITQHRCMETWFLGNRKVYKGNPENKTLVEYQQFYNVSQNDPEYMGVLPRLAKRNINHAHFHEDYLIKMLRERNMLYKKRQPNAVLTSSYFQELQKRTRDDDLASFQRFLTLYTRFKEQL